MAAMCAARCRHHFCKDCWAGYVSHAIASGPSVLSLRCPIPACPAVVRPLPAMWARLQKTPKPISFLLACDDRLQK